MSEVSSVEVTDEALGDIARQLDPDAAWSFTRLDMLPALVNASARRDQEIADAMGQRMNGEMDRRRSS